VNEQYTTVTIKHINAASATVRWLLTGKRYSYSVSVLGRTVELTSGTYEIGGVRINLP